MKKQTAVEWLIGQICVSVPKIDEHGFEVGVEYWNAFIGATDLSKYIEQAKAMERQQHEDTFDKSRLAKIFEKGMPPVYENFDQYFNETYGE